MQYCDAFWGLSNTENLIKVLFMIYGDLEFLIENTDGWRNNPGISSTTKLGENILSNFSMSTILSYKGM